MLSSTERQPREAGRILGPEAVPRPDFLAALGGIGVTLAINFGVSFSLALGVALRARDLPVAEVLRLVRLMGARFLRQPRSFLPPPREDTLEATSVLPPAHS